MELSMQPLRGLMLGMAFLAGRFDVAGAQSADSAQVRSDSAPSKPDTTSAAPAAAALPVNLSGFVTASYTYATRHNGSQIVGRLYDRFHDQVELNAAKVVLEKPVATDRWSAGARIDLLL